MTLDDRFDDLAAGLGGFHQTWIAYLGIELGLVARLREAGPGGLSAAELAAACGCQLDPIYAWSRAAHAAGLVAIDGDRVIVDPDVARILLDDKRPEYLGGQFVSTIVSSLDYEGLADFVRSGRPTLRPDRYRQAIERLTAQDIAVFFEEVLGSMPNLVSDLSRGGRVADLHCGGGRWLIAMARRFPALELLGIEFEPESIERARRNVAEAGLEDRVRIEPASITEMGHVGEFDLAYFQYALHHLPDPVAALQSAWASLRPGGRLIALDWCLPASVEDDPTLMGELLWGMQLDELYGGTRMLTRDEMAGLFESAGLPEATAFETPSGASVVRVRRPPDEGIGG